MSLLGWGLHYLSGVKSSSDTTGNAKAIKQRPGTLGDASFHLTKALHHTPAEDLDRTTGGLREGLWGGPVVRAWNEWMINISSNEEGRPRLHPGPIVHHQQPSPLILWSFGTFVLQK